MGWMKTILTAAETATAEEREALDELVHEAAAANASRINNAGSDQQLQYLVDQGVEVARICAALGIDPPVVLTEAQKDLLTGAVDGLDENNKETPEGELGYHPWEQHVRCRHEAVSSVVFILDDLGVAGALADHYLFDEDNVLAGLSDADATAFVKTLFPDPAELAAEDLLHGWTEPDEPS